MSAAATAPKDEPAADAEATPLGKKKKLMMMIATALAAVLVLGGGGGAYFVMKKRAAAAAAAEEDGAESGSEAHAAVKADLKHAPTFVPLDPFTVNLADRDAERYAQVGMTMELVDTKAADLIKAYMPAIRNNILLLLASKNATQLMEHEGKVRLAEEVRAAALKPLGWDVKKPGAKSGDDDEAPIRAVHFSNFIIQ